MSYLAMKDHDEELCSKEQISKLMSQILAPGRRLQELIMVGCEISYIRDLQRYILTGGGVLLDMKKFHKLINGELQ